MDKTEVARELGISVRAVERAVADGHITPTKERKTGGGFRWRFDADEVERYRREKEERQKGTVTVPRQAEKEAAILAALHALAQGMDRQVGLLADVGRRLALPPGPDDHTATHPTVGGVVVPVADKLLLTLAEASALTGLSRGTLRAAIDSRQLKARIVGRAWRVKRVDLDVYVKKL